MATSATTIGLRLLLTVCGCIEFVIPQIFHRHVDISKSLINTHLTNLKLRRDTCLTTFKVHATTTKRRGQFVLRRAKHKVINRIAPPTSRFLLLPGEIRNEVYQWLCTPKVSGTICPNILLTNRQIYAESRSYFDSIEHVISIGDLERFQAGSIDFIGAPRIMRTDHRWDWHMASLKHLVLELRICSIGIMTPDCFDVYLAHNGKEQWRSLKRLIGIWPELREVPLESVRLDLGVSKYDANLKKYRADLIRVIRNFKRTRVWAETADGSCEVRRANCSILLPLVRAFNQGRRNWDAESDVENNLIVRYDRHILATRAIDVDQYRDEGMVEEVRQKWSIQPTDDTSRSDNSVWPEWTGKEEKYIHDKMVRRDWANDREWECGECLAVFDKPRELRAHIARRKWKK